MHRVFLIALLPLAACGTPQEQCIRNAGKDIRILNGLINTTRANINRGYAISSQEYFENEEQACGEIAGEVVYCDVAVAHSRDVAVAIDLNAEQAKLNSLTQKHADLSQRASSVVDDCKRRNPEA